MADPNHSVILGADHTDKTADLLNAYCHHACAYFEDYHALLGSVVSMRKALELMGAYYLFHFIKKKIYVQSGNEVFRGRYDLPQGSSHLFERMKALCLGASLPDGRILPGLSSILHYQGYSCKPDGHHAHHERDSLFLSHKLFLTLFPEFQSVSREFCQMADIDMEHYSGLSKLQDILCDLELTFPLLQNVETLLCITFDEYPQQGWLEWYARILLKYDTNEAQDELLTDHTIMACCRSIAEKVMYECACRANPGYASAIREQRNYALDRYITDYRNCPTPQSHDEQEAKSKDLSRALTIRSYADANLHWVDRSLNSSMMRFEDLHDTKTVLINWQKMIQCGSELIRCVILSDQPKAIQRLIDRYYERVPELQREMERLLQENEALRKQIDSAQETANEDTERNTDVDLIEQLSNSFQELFGDKKPSWLEERRRQRQTSEQKNEAPVNQEYQPSNHLCGPSEHTLELALPAVKGKRYAEKKELPALTILDGEGTHTLVFQIKGVVMEQSHQIVYYACPIRSIDEKVDGGIKRTFNVEFNSEFQENNKRIEKIITLKIVPDEHYAILNAVECTCDQENRTKSYFGTKPGKVAFDTGSRQEDVCFDQLQSLGIPIRETERPKPSNLDHPEKEFISDYRPEVLSFIMIDPRTEEVVAPEVFFDNNKPKIRYVIQTHRSYIALQIRPEEAMTHAETCYRFGEAYCHGERGLPRDMMRAMDQFYQGYQTNETEDEKYHALCCYELGCIFRYDKEVYNDEDALEFLSIAAKRVVPEAMFEWSKAILSGDYSTAQRLQAAKYLLELLQYGYRTCGAEKLSVFLPIIIPIAEEEISNCSISPDEATLCLMYDLAAAYELMGRMEDARTLFQKIMAAIFKRQEQKHECLLELVDAYDKRLVQQQRYSEAAELRKRMRHARVDFLAGYWSKNAEKLIEALDELGDQYWDYWRYRDWLNVTEKLYETQKKVFDWDEDALSAASSYATALYIIGRYEEARSMDEKVLEIRRGRADLAEAKLKTAIQNAAVCNLMTGNLEKALTLQQEAATLYEQELGCDHLKTRIANRWIAEIYTALGKTDKAQGILQPLVHWLIESEGAEDRDTLIAKRCMAWNDHIAGHNDDAIKQFNELLDQMRHSLGECNRATLTAAYQRIQVLEQQGLYQSVLESLQEWLPMLECAYGEDSPKVMEAKALKARCETSIQEEVK